MNAVNCPICNRPTRRMVYDRHGKRCPDCNDPNFIRVFDLAVPPEYITASWLRYITQVDAMVAGRAKSK